MPEKRPFWESKTLEEMSPAEWESLCDGCARCCLHKIEDIDTGEIFFTQVVCHLLDLDTCQCTDYENRSERVPNCLHLTPEMVAEINWLPATCAYRRIAGGKGLAWWHPLVSGDLATVRLIGASVCGKAVSENEVDLEDIEDMVVDWFD